MPKISNGYGYKLESTQDLQWLAENLYRFVTLDDAAPQICPTWKRFHIHKEIKYNRVFLDQILIIEDEQLYTPFSDSKKMFISIEEIERLKEDVASRPKRKLRYICEWCKRRKDFCIKKPCPTREHNSPEHIQSVETVAEFFGRYLKKHDKQPKEFREFNSEGERKRFASR